MATRKDAAGISGRTITIENNGKFDRIKTISEANTILTGSLQGARGFIIESAGNTVLSPTKGDVINASALTVAWEELNPLFLNIWITIFFSFFPSTIDHPY